MTTENTTAAELDARTNEFLDTITEDDALKVFAMMQERFGLMGAVFGRKHIEGTFTDRLGSQGGSAAAVALAPELAKLVERTSSVKDSISSVMADAGSCEMDEQLDEFIMPFMDYDFSMDLVLFTEKTQTVRIAQFDTIEEMTEFAQKIIGRTVADVLAEVKRDGNDLVVTNDGASDEETITSAHVVAWESFAGQKPEELVKLA